LFFAIPLLQFQLIQHFGDPFSEVCDKPLTPARAARLGSARPHHARTPGRAGPVAAEPGSEGLGPSHGGSPGCLLDPKRCRGYYDLDCDSDWARTVRWTRSRPRPGHEVRAEGLVSLGCLVRGWGPGAEATPGREAHGDPPTCRPRVLTPTRRRVPPDRGSKLWRVPNPSLAMGAGYFRYRCLLALKRDQRPR
jgi:hypothetical protein